MDKNHLTKPFWFANVWTFFPDLGIDDLEINYLKWRALQSSFALMAHPALLTQVLDQEIVQTIPRDLTGMCIAFHYGPYRMLPRYLIAAGYRITVVASAEVIKRDSESVYNELLINDLPKDTLKYIDATRPTVLRSIVSAVKDRRIVLIYLDADEGVRKIAAKNHQALIKVPIAQKQLYFHSNSARLAYKFGIPISFMLMDRDDIDGRWKVSITNKLVFKKNEPLKGYLKRFKMKFAVVLNKIMGQYWMAWENWPMLHLYQPNLAQTNHSTSNDPVWVMPICMRQRQFFFDVKNKRFFEIKLD
ncbi:hypothetical protein [Sphingobacterium ginsenosidimutans]|uniref:Lipid A biosynthesis acyltransferase n=1 Tax=Sphingobacterium ginsenosidimutans TaxID=687845 RepID=A0ABP8A1N1_9SPHI